MDYKKALLWIGILIILLTHSFLLIKQSSMDEKQTRMHSILNLIAGLMIVYGVWDFDS